MLPIIKKEVKTYFLSPIAYVFIGIFALISSFVFYNTVLYPLNRFEEMFNIISFLFLIIIPVLTMRMFSEERKNGTEQLLYTSPRSITSIVLGKYFSAVIVMIIYEILLMVYGGILLILGQLNIGTTLIALMGLLFLAMADISFGMFISSLTENQIIAGIVTMAGLIIMFLIPTVNTNLLRFSIIDVFWTTFSKGIITIQGSFLLLSFSMLFITLTIISINRRKKLK